jgi:hypothetical protein
MAGKNDSQKKNIRDPEHFRNAMTAGSGQTANAGDEGEAARRGCGEDPWGIFSRIFLELPVDGQADVV